MLLCPLQRWIARLAPVVGLILGAQAGQDGGRLAGSEFRTGIQIVASLGLRHAPLPQTSPHADTPPPANEGPRMNLVRTMRSVVDAGPR